jgi:hypothetical protein
VGFVALSVSDFKSRQAACYRDYKDVDNDDGCPDAVATYNPDYPTVSVDETGNTRNTF